MSATLNLATSVSFFQEHPSRLSPRRGSPLGFTALAITMIYCFFTIASAALSPTPSSSISHHLSAYGNTKVSHLDSFMFLG